MKTGFRIIALAFYALFLSACTSTTGTVPTYVFKDGQVAYDSKDYEQALTIWKTVAKNGDAEAAFQLGDMYELAIGAEQNQRQAAKWYKYAAKRGHQNAQYRLADKYHWGSGVNQDLYEAYMWYAICSTKNSNSGRLTQDCQSSMSTMLSVLFLDSKSRQHAFKRAEKRAEKWEPIQ